jgi:hypothetical protein
MKTTLVTTALATATWVALAAPATAGGAQHAVYVEEFDDTWTMSAEENSCGPWPGTLHEIRHGEYRIVAARGGQIDGEYHVNGVVDGWFALDPDSDGPLPTYVGTYREKATGVFFGEDGERVGQYRLRSVARSEDGGTLRLVLKGKRTVNANGTVATEREISSCEIS